MQCLSTVFPDPLSFSFVWLSDVYLILFASSRWFLISVVLVQLVTFLSAISPPTTCCSKFPFSDFAFLFLSITNEYNSLAFYLGDIFPFQFPSSAPFSFQIPSLDLAITLLSLSVQQDIYILRSTSHFSVTSMKLETSLPFAVTQHIYLYVIAP